MKAYAIHAYEEIYGGLHGMDEHLVVIVNSDDEAEEIATEASYNVMDSFGCIDDDLILNALEACNYELADDEDIYDAMDDTVVYEAYEEERCSNVAYDIWQLKDECLSMDLSDLTDEFFNTPDEFLEKYRER